MNFLNKILETLDFEDKKMMIIIFFIIVVTNIIEILNIGSLVAIANILIDESKFYNLIKDFPILKNIFLKKETDSILKLFLIFSLIFLILKSLILLILFWIKNKFLFNFEVKLRDRLLNKYLNQNYSFFLNKNVSYFLRNINTECGNFRYIALQAPLQICIDSILIILISLSLLVIQPYETLSLIFMLSSVLIIYYILLKPYLKKWGEKKLETENKIINNLTETFNIIKEIIIYKLKNRFIKKNLTDHTRLANINVINYFASELPRHFLEIFGIGVVIIYLYFLFHTGNIDTTNLVLNLTIYSVALYKLLPSFVRVSNGIKDIKYGLPVLNTIYNDIKLKDTLSKENTKSSLTFEKTIEFRNIELPYIENKETKSRKINLTINKNESVVIIGKSGSGKSTILNLLSGIIQPYNGKILTDGADINNNLYEWHSKISYLDQNIFLINDSIKNNITLINENEKINEQKLTESINFASANDLINKKINKLDFIVGEKNKYISGGEAQRIALAKIFYRNSEILLLDEFTLNLDQNNMKNIVQNLAKLKENKTVILTTHETSILKYFDKIIDLDNFN